MPQKGETFEYLFLNCLKYEAEQRLKIMAHICSSGDERLKKCLTYEKFIRKQLDYQQNQILKKSMLILLDRFKRIKHKERPLYVMHAIFLWIFRDLISWGTW